MIYSKDNCLKNKKVPFSNLKHQTPPTEPRKQLSVGLLTMHKVSCAESNLHLPTLGKVVKSVTTKLLPGIRAESATQHVVQSCK